jgi:hypothetical protein
LRFRKDNGRIASDVLSYEKNYAPLSETEEEDQKILSKFLFNKDTQKTDELKKSLIHAGQRDPAIITCDGFLINGNRRKLSLELLQKDFLGEEKYKCMKVVILPDEGEEGGPPTIKEIEQIENRYQMQSDGKAEYYNFDRALSIRRKIEAGIPLDEQLRDDPNFATLPQREFKKELERISDELLGPLECVDHYLESLGRNGLYDTVSAARGDSEGRWQAFIDYYGSVYKSLKSERKRIEMGIEEDEVGLIEDISFKIIRKREIPTLGKVHQLMRSLPKWLKNSEAKRELLKIVEIDNNLPAEETVDSEGNELDPRIVDRFWGGKNETEITKHVRLAKDYVEYNQIAETPLTLLDAALKKLTHEQMLLQSVQPSDQSKARSLIGAIRERIKNIEHEFYQIQKGNKNIDEIPEE